MSNSLGEQFAHAVATKDHDAVLRLLHPDLDFQAMTPRRIWEAEQPQDVVAALKTWFDDGDTIEELVGLEQDEFADRQRVGYRLRVRNDDGLHLVEQQVYFEHADDKITWMRTLCAGYIPV